MLRPGQPLTLPATASTASNVAPEKTDEQLEQPLLARLQQLVAPLDRGPERLLALGQVARAARAAAASRLSSRSTQRLRREEVDPRRGELDRQRQAVQPQADLGDGGGVVVRQPEVGPDRLGALDEQLDRLVLGELLRRMPFAGGAAARRAAGPRTSARRARAAPRGWSPAA